MQMKIDTMEIGLYICASCYSEAVMKAEFSEETSSRFVLKSKNFRGWRDAFGVRN